MGAPSNLSFGLTGTPTPAAQAPNLAGPAMGFGAMTQPAPAPAFGAPISTQQQSVTFGATTSIGQPPPPAFGATSTAPTLSFGATPASTAAGFGGFAAKPMGTSTLSFGAPLTNTTPLFGQTAGITSTAAVATVQPTLSFGGGAPVASVAPSTSFNFSAQQPAMAVGGGLT